MTDLRGGPYDDVDCFISLSLDASGRVGYVASGLHKNPSTC